MCLLSKKTLHWVAKPQRGAPGYIHVRVLRNRTIFSRTVRGVAGSCRNAYMLQFAAKCFKQERNLSNDTSRLSIDQRKKISRSKIFALLNQQKIDLHNHQYLIEGYKFFFAIYSWSKILNEMQIDRFYDL